MTRFPCTSCGACCSLINGIDFLEEYNVNGKCVNLKLNQCSIYQSRPLLCRIDDAYEKLFSTYMSKEEFYYQNALACNELQQKLNIDVSYRISLDDLLSVSNKEAQEL